MDLGQCLQLAALGFIGAFKGAQKYGTVVVYAAHLEHKGNGLHLVVGLAAQDKFGARLGGNVTVAGGIDNGFSVDFSAAGLVDDGNTLDFIALHNGILREGVKKQLTAHFVQHF